MAGENDNLLESLMGMLGDNPQEKISQIIGSLSSQSSNALAEEREEKSTQDIDIGTLLKLKSAFSTGGNEDDNTRLLSAIKPFLNDKRKPQVDSLLKILKIANVAQKAGGMDILKNLKL